MNTTAAAPLRLTVRGRRVLLALAALPVAAAIALGATHMTSATAASEAADVEFEYVTVRAGDTLWGIAEEVAGDADVRDVIVEISKLNALENGSVQAGQRLALPND
ncbi:LysM peptidoglycan-binding domain-containing protein [Pseudoclavibacter helvolus]|uniref:LysM peptidoglycan-binding domain-containing protein n=1 Tax=Pseudoclavibacter helvolus TaxID=255205 RepID=UPI003C740252